jgi:hypothetical protein
VIETDPKYIPDAASVETCPMTIEEWAMKNKQSPWKNMFIRASGQANPPRSAQKTLT